MKSRNLLFLERKLFFTSSKKEQVPRLDFRSRSEPKCFARDGSAIFFPLLQQISERKTPSGAKRNWQRGKAQSFHIAAVESIGDRPYICKAPRKAICPGKVPSTK